MLRRPLDASYIIFEFGPSDCQQNYMKRPYLV